MIPFVKGGIHLQPFRYSGTAAADRRQESTGNKKTAAEAAVLFLIGGTNWTRTSDPHDVNVVL